MDQFNTGMYDLIIASDEASLDPATGGKNSAKEFKARSKSGQKDSEYGVARGIDFQSVSNVINFDFPSSSDAYIHRVGRSV